MINSKENQFGTLLSKYMDRIRAKDNAVAKEIGVNRLTIAQWKKGEWMPSKKNYDKIVACADFLRLTEEEKSEFIISAGFQEENFPPNDLADEIFDKYISGLFSKLAQLNPHPIMLLLTQANWSDPPCREAILRRAKQVYFRNVLHIHPPVSLSVDRDSYFAHLGEQCGMECVKNDYDFEQGLKKRIEKSQRLFLLVSRFEQGVPTLGEHLASIIRNLSEDYANRFHVILCGGEKLAALKYESGHLSLLNFAKDEHWTELGRDEVCILRKHRFPNLNLYEILVDRLLEISGGHPKILNQCLAFQSNFPELDLAKYPDKLSRSDEISQLFIPFIKTRMQKQWNQWLAQDRVAEWQPYILDDVLRELYWKNALIRREKEGESGLYWRCKAIKMAGKRILGREH